MKSWLDRWFWLRSFRFKLMMASIICVLLPSCITLTLYNYLTQDAVKEQAISNSQDSMLLVNNYLTNSLKYMLNIANSIHMDSELNTIFKENVYGKRYTGPSAEYDEFLDKNKIMKQIDNITIGGEDCYVTILLANGTYYANYSIYEYNPLNLTQEPWFAQLKDLYGFESYWVGSSPTVFQSAKPSSPYQVSVVRTLRNEGAVIYGYIIVTVMENQLNHNFGQPGNNQDFMIVGPDNVILSHQDSGRIGQTFPLPYVDQESKRMISNIVQVNHEDYLMTQQPLSFTGWKLVSLTPYKAAISQIGAIFNKVFVFQVISFIVFLLLLLYLLGTFTKPLVRLGKVALTVQKGDLTTRSHIRGADEIGRLGFWFDQMLERIQEMIAEISLTHARIRKAELAMLQAQINPHFLFNVLNSIRMKVLLRGDKESAEMIGSLSKLLRMTINQEKGTISLHEEVEIVMDYMVLMNMRQKEHVELRTDVAADALFVKVPRFFLQPLIENALIHGLTQAAGIITLKAWTEENVLVVTVADNGKGMSEAVLQQLRSKLVADGTREQPEAETRGSFSGIGLSNVYERLRMTYGERFSMQVESIEKEGTLITMRIPRLEGAVPYV
jgi:two-component system sensor histidine kinase YesM